MRKRGLSFILAVLALAVLSSPLSAHPMGNFSINHYARINASSKGISVHVVLDYAEIPTFQLFSNWGIRSDLEISPAEVQLMVGKLVSDLKPQFRLLIDGSPAMLQISNIKPETTPGAGGLLVFRVSFDLFTAWELATVRLEFFDDSYRERIGWKEMVVGAEPGFEFSGGNSFSIDRSAALTNYPGDSLASSPDVSSISVRIKPGNGVNPAATGFKASEAAARGVLGSFLSGSVVQGDRLSEILGHRELPIRLILVGLGIAFLLGALHAMSPGHGKTLVAAYLVGNRGTARHAIVLGAIVTFTHTVGVFLLGIVTLFASNYIVPEKLYPWMGLISGLTILAVGLNLLGRRLSSYEHESQGHDHGPGGHTHEIPERITLRNLLALGVSGGIVPCPSALVVLLSAIALHRVELGLLLLVAFSMGLASLLVVIGLIVVRAGRVIQRTPVAQRLAGVLPIVSAGIITVIGIGIAAESFASTGLLGDTSLLLQTQALVVLGLGLLLGLKHATDADHIVAVTTFVSESKSLWRSCGIGVFWGIGHTLSLALAGLLVIVFKVSIPSWVEARLEFVVALMLVALGARVLIRTIQRKIELHAHTHVHSGTVSHSHWHIHTSGEKWTHDHAGWTHLGLRPLLVGMVHGAAGSAALMLLVLSTIRSPLEAFLYILVFGFGSVLGMLLISCLLALPLHWAKGRVATSYKPIQLTAGLFSCLFGLYLGFQIWSSMP